tara:strand:- start:155 stop:463 length:309 start_codon:yes stop_codon:yes gene_type:complete
MSKYYLFLFLIVGMALFYIYSQDPCNEQFRADFSNRYPAYEILSFGHEEGSGAVDTVARGTGLECHIYYKKPDSDQTHEDVWLYRDQGGGSNYSYVSSAPAD